MKDRDTGTPTSVMDEDETETMGRAAAFALDTLRHLHTQEHPGTNATGGSGGLDKDERATHAVCHKLIQSHLRRMIGLGTAEDAKATDALKKRVKEAERDIKHLHAIIAEYHPHRHYDPSKP